MIDPDKRYLLARPRGGLNDTLVQLDMVRRYAGKMGRVLILDMSRSGLHCAYDDLFTVCEGFGCEVIPWSPELGKVLDTLTSVRPAVLAGRGSSYLSEYRKDTRRFHDCATGTELRFDLEADHPEQLLVYEQCGGGLRGIEVLGHLAFTRDIANEIATRLLALGPDYDAIHIRHSDYRTDYQAFLRKAAPLFAGRRLLVCSDNAQVKAEAEACLAGNVEVVSIADIPDTSGVPLHVTEDIDRAAANVDLLAELVAMTRAKRFVFTQLSKEGNFFGKFSGFAMLAEALRVVPDTVTGLFANADRSLTEELFRSDRRASTRGSLRHAITRRLAALDEFRWNYDARKRARRIRRRSRNGTLSV